MRRDVRQAAVCPAPTADGPAPSECHHLLQLLTDQVRRGGAEGDGRLQHLEAGLVAEVRTPGGEAVASQGVGVQGHLLQGGQGGEELSRKEAELVTVEEESPEGGQVTEGGSRRGAERERDQYFFHHHLLLFICSRNVQRSLCNI